MPTKAHLPARVETAARIGAKKMIVLTRMWNGFEAGTQMPLIGSGQAVELVRRGIAHYVDNVSSDNGTNSGTDHARRVEKPPENLDLRLRHGADTDPYGGKKGRRTRH